MRWKMPLGASLVLICAFGGNVDFMGQRNHPVTMHGAHG